jgi:hypothetical protein
MEGKCYNEHSIKGHGHVDSTTKDIIALTRQSLAATDKVLYCFSLHSTESAGWISVEKLIQLTLYGTDGKNLYV